MKLVTTSLNNRSVCEESVRDRKFRKLCSKGHKNNLYVSKDLETSSVRKQEYQK
jgi:hypothetical protein